MYETVRNHKLLLNVILVIILTLMCLNGVCSNCNNGFRTMTLYSDFTKGHLRINGSRVIASRCDQDCGDSHLQMITVDRHYFLIFDPHAKMFICWNPRFTKVVARKNVNLKRCKFEEGVSQNRHDSMTEYTTQSNNHSKVKLQFNKRGHFFTKQLHKNCIRNKEKFAARNGMSGSYKKNSCAMSPDFVAKVIDCDSKKFCKDMFFLHQQRNILEVLKKFCTSEWNHHNRYIASIP